MYDWDSQASSVSSSTMEEPALAREAGRPDAAGLLARSIGVRAKIRAGSCVGVVLVALAEGVALRLGGRGLGHAGVACGVGVLVLGVVIAEGDASGDASGGGHPALVVEGHAHAGLSSSIMSARLSVSSSRE